MRGANVVTVGVIAAGAVLVVWDSLRLGIGWGTDGPRSGFFPFWLAVLMMAACLGILVQALRDPSREPFVRRESLRPVLTVLVPAATYVGLIEVVGFYVASALYLAVNMRWLGRYAWSGAAGLGVAFALVVFVVFEQWFLVPLPKGPLEGWLGY